MENTGLFGVVVRRLPLCGIMKVGPKNASPNVYDILWPSNLKQIFGPTVLLWGVPFYTPEMAG